MVTLVMLVVLGVVVALMVSFTAGKDRYAEMSEKEFEAEAKRASLLGDRKSTRLNSSHSDRSRMPSSA